jgi:negative regulator of flagellin synthesis FlgM
MINAIKEYVMVNQLDERANFKPIDSENMRFTRAANKVAEMDKETANTVHLSNTSKQMEALKAFILSAPEINAAKTAFIKEAIAEDRYTMHNENIAAKMLAEV